MHVPMVLQPLLGLPSHKSITVYDTHHHPTHQIYSKKKKKTVKQVPVLYLIKHIKHYFLKVFQLYFSQTCFLFITCSFIKHHQIYQPEMATVISNVPL